MFSILTANLYLSSREGNKARIFEVSEKEVSEIEEWKKIHDQKCLLNDGMLRGFTPISKYTYAFVETGIGDSLEVICDCGEKFSPLSRTEDW